MDEIYKRDLKIYPWQEGTVRFYAYLAIWKKELVKVTVAVTKQKKQWCCKQVAVHGIHSATCFVRDMEYNYFGYGYRVGWFAEELQSFQNGSRTASGMPPIPNTMIPMPAHQSRRHRQNTRIQVQLLSALYRQGYHLVPSYL